MIQFIPIVIDTITATINLIATTKNSKVPPKMKKANTVINNYYVTVNQQSPMPDKPANTKPTAVEVSKPFDLSNGVMIGLFFVFIIAEVFCIRFYCRWATVINSMLSTSVLIASLFYGRVLQQYSFDRNTKIKHTVFFLQPILFRGATIATEHFLETDKYLQQFQLVYDKGFEASLSLFWELIINNNGGFTFFVLSQLNFAILMLAALVMFFAELAIIWWGQEVPLWVRKFYGKWNGITYTPLIALISLILAFIL